MSRYTGRRDDPAYRRMRASKHAQRGLFCSCGKRPRGNGGKASHAAMHERRADGHREVSEKVFYEMFPPQAGEGLERA